MFKPNLMLTIWNFQFSHNFKSACEHDTSLEIAYIMLQLYKDILHTNNSDEFNIDLSVTFLSPPPLASDW